MAEAERLLLANIDRATRLLTDTFDHGERLAPRVHRVFELVRNVEMVFQRALAAPGDEDDLLDPRLQRFLHRILDQRLVDDRQHFLRDSLGGGQKTRAEAGNRKDGLSDLTLFTHQYLQFSVILQKDGREDPTAVA